MESIPRRTNCFASRCSSGCTILGVARGVFAVAADPLKARFLFYGNSLNPTESEMLFNLEAHRGQLSHTLSEGLETIVGVSGAAC